MKKKRERDVLEKIKLLKSQPFRSVLITGVHAHVPYNLVLLTREIAQDVDIISHLANWRKMHEVWFPAQFPVTEERTARWLNTHVLEASDRLLFLIEIAGTYIGHVGLFRFNDTYTVCEIDNIVRGVGGYPGIMGVAITSMMQWGRENLGLDSYTLETTSDNTKALSLYNKLGFSEIKRVPMVYEKTKDGGQWVEAKEDKKNIGRYTVFMSL